MTEETKTLDGALAGVSDSTQLLGIALAALKRIAECVDAPDIDASGDWLTRYGHTVGVERGLEWASNEAKQALEQMPNAMLSGAGKASDAATSYASVRRSENGEAGYGGELAAALEREERLRQAIEWALGVRGEFGQRAEKDGAYWWRKKLQQLAGLKWDGEKFIDV